MVQDDLARHKLTYPCVMSTTLFWHEIVAIYVVQYLFVVYPGMVGIGRLWHSLLLKQWAIKALGKYDMQRSPIDSRARFSQEF